MLDVGARLSIGADRLNANPCSLDFELLVDPVMNFPFVAQRDDRVDQPLTTAVGKILITPAECFQIVGIVGQPRNTVTHKRRAAARALAGVGVQNDRLLDTINGVGPILRAYLGSMLDGTEYGWMPLVSPAASFTIFRTECSDDDPQLLPGWNSAVCRLL